MSGSVHINSITRKPRHRNYPPGAEGKRWRRWQRANPIGNFIWVLNPDSAIRLGGRLVLAAWRRVRRGV
jgi:hypothetical protein